MTLDEGDKDKIGNFQYSCKTTVTVSSMEHGIAVQMEFILLTFYVWVCMYYVYVLQTSFQIFFLLFNSKTC